MVSLTRAGHVSLCRGRAGPPGWPCEPPCPHCDRRALVPRPTLTCLAWPVVLLSTSELPLLLIHRTAVSGSQFMWPGMRGTVWGLVCLAGLPLLQACCLGSAWLWVCGWDFVF